MKNLICRKPGYHIVWMLSISIQKGFHHYRPKPYWFSRLLNSIAKNFFLESWPSSFHWFKPHWFEISCWSWPFGWMSSFVKGASLPVGSVATCVSIQKTQTPAGRPRRLRSQKKRRGQPLQEHDLIKHITGEFGCVFLAPLVFAMISNSGPATPFEKPKKTQRTTVARTWSYEKYHWWGIRSANSYFHFATGIMLKPAQDAQVEGATSPC